ncbi:hypothetical protein Prudu_018370 [Prunus dulcis]|uniref:Uncharacterized protein n=1 Tax=Prunus dulcis TaxID=3755 RepID=A0A4Y1RQL6_PRUDU|nr:hypothetical protein Prudu_018370 [Prunus dulcis]
MPSQEDVFLLRETTVMARMYEISMLPSEESRERSSDHQLHIRPYFEDKKLTLFVPEMPAVESVTVSLLFCRISKTKGYETFASNFLFIRPKDLLDRYFRPAILNWANQ